MNGDKENIALVTGAATRIGRGIAASIAEAGWAVAVHFSKSEAAAQETAAEITSAGGRAEIFSANLRDEDEIMDLVSAVEESLGPITCLINNASIFESDSVGTVTRETWDAHMEVNLRAPFVLSQVLAQNLLKTKTANIINILDQRVLNLTPHFASYTISKSALWTLTRTLAIALAPRIRVNAIGPGPTLPSIRQSDDDFEKQYNSLPLQSPVNVSEICAAVRFILECPSMTGQLITIDGGQHLGWAQPGHDTNDGE